MTVLRVGLLGCGEIAQVAHIPNLNFNCDRFQITYLQDVSRDALAHCAPMVRGVPPQTTVDAAEVCASPDVDVVLICSSDADHVAQGLLALQHGKWVLIEKPLSFCKRDLDRLIAAEAQLHAAWKDGLAAAAQKAGHPGDPANPPRVFVGTMRRYASAFLEAVQEVGGLDRILYARVRSLIGPNTNFVRQSGTLPRTFSDYTPEASADRAAREADIFACALRDEIGVAVTPETKSQLHILGSNNTHDLSAMREILGMPKRALGACLGFPGIYNVLFEYDGFGVTFESGIHGVPIFDAHIEVYAQDKIVRVDYDTPYVKGLPVTLTIREKVPSRPGNDSSFGFQERHIRRTYEDPYQLELLSFYDSVVNGAPVKTTAADSLQDLELFRMIMKAGENTYKK